jgi:hypothetical protein
VALGNMVRAEQHFELRCTLVESMVGCVERIAVGQGLPRSGEDLGLESKIAAHQAIDQSQWGRQEPLIEGPCRPSIPSHHRPDGREGQRMGPTGQEHFDSQREPLSAAGGILFMLYDKKKK